MWSALGSYPRENRNNLFGMSLAVILALETFNNKATRYPIWLTIIVLASGTFIFYKAKSAKSYIGLATSIFSLSWIMPIFNTDIFYHVDLWFFTAHSILAMAVAVGAFSYLKN